MKQPDLRRQEDPVVEVVAGGPRRVVLHHVDVEVAVRLVARAPDSSDAAVITLLYFGSLKYATLLLFDVVQVVARQAAR